jgi:hypothetical protein
LKCAAFCKCRRSVKTRCGARLAWSKLICVSCHTGSFRSPHPLVILESQTVLVCSCRTSCDGSYSSTQSIGCFRRCFVCSLFLAGGEPSINSFGVDRRPDLGLSMRPVMLCGVVLRSRCPRTSSEHGLCFCSEARVREVFRPSLVRGAVPLHRPHLMARGWHPGRLRHPGRCHDLQGRAQ